MGKYATHFNCKFSIILIEKDQTVIDSFHHAAALCFPEATCSVLQRYEDVTDYLDTLNGYTPKLVFLEVFSPDNVMGLALIQRIKQRKSGQALPIIILSQSDNQDHVTQAYESGASSYIVKPASPAEWHDLLRNIRLFWYQTATMPPLAYI